MGHPRSRDAVMARLSRSPAYTPENQELHQQNPHIAVRNKQEIELDQYPATDSLPLPLPIAVQ
jgi:hypothetical protein